MAEVIRFEDAALTVERDRTVWRMRCLGESVRAIAEACNCSVAEVEKSMTRMQGAATPDYLARAMMLELARLDETERAFTPYALGHTIDGKRNKPDPEAAAIKLRVMEHRAKLLGLYRSPGQGDPLDKMKVKESSTEKARDVLDRLTGKANRTIEGEVIKKDEDGN